MNRTALRCARSTLLAGALLAAVTGCLPTGPPPEVDAFRATTERFQSARTDSFRLHLQTNSTNPEAGTTVTEGAVSVGAGRPLGELTVRSRRVAELRVRFTAKALYLGGPDMAAEMDGKQWMRMSLGAAAAKAGLPKETAAFGKNSDPREPILAIVRSGRFRRIGPDHVNGVPCVRYVGQVAAANALDGDEAVKPRDRVRADLWFAESDGLPRRLVTEVRTADGLVTVALELSDYGVRVAAVDPPEAQVLDFADLVTSES